MGAHLSGPEFPLKELSHTNINQVVSVCVCVGGEEVQTARGGSPAAAKSDIKPGALALSEEWEGVRGGGGLGGGAK